MKGGDTLNPIQIILSEGSSSSTAHGATATKPLASDGALFKTKLGGALSSLAGASSTADADLVKRIRALLDNGTSLNDVITSLAGSLASSVAAQLGIPTGVAKQRLTEAFTKALAPTGTGPPTTNADRASTLAQRFRQVAELATRVTNGDPGQPIRTIAGTSLDAATTAKANPAPSTDTIVRDATNALAAPASPAVATPLAGPPTPGDGKTVAFDPSAAIASGGDTPLGRIVARAVISSPSANPDVPTPAMSARNAVIGKPIAPPAEPDGSLVNTKTLDGFLKSFTDALDKHDAMSASPLVATTTSDGTQSTMSFAIPVAHDSPPAAPVAPPVQTSTLPQPQHVDASAVVDQVLRGINVRTTPGSTEVKLRLVPETLGDVTVKLVVSGGTVDATITTHNADTQNVLAGAQTQLARTLADAGLKLQSFSVGLAGGGFASARDGSNQQQRPSQPSRRFGNVTGLEADDADDENLLAVPSFGPSIYTATPARGLNYLV